MSPLAPGFLIASAPMGDPSFDRAVVALALHSERGALGFVVNRRSSLTLGTVMSLAGYGPRMSPIGGVVLAGGPVERGSGWILASGDEEGEEPSLRLSDAVRVSSERRAFERLARDLEPATEDPTLELRGLLGRRVVMLGYAGWGPSQLESEIRDGAWIPAPFDERLIFDSEPEACWEKAHASLGLVPAMGFSMRSRGSA